MLSGVASFIKPGVDDSGGGTLEEGVISVIPLGFSLLLLKPAVFPAVKQLHQEAPDDQDQDAYEEHAGNGAAHDQGDVGRLWALSIRIDDDGVYLLTILLDHTEGHPTVLGILFPAFPILFAHLC